MAIFQKNLLNHLKYINKWLAEYGLEASLQLPDMRLRVAARGREVCLSPRFLQAGSVRKAHLGLTLNPKSNGFAGWLPVTGSSWPEAVDKRAFWTRAAAAGLRVPPCFDDAADVEGDVLVKRCHSSPVEALRGPFAAASLNSDFAALGADEYYERFVVGRSLRAWFWRGRPVCAELDSKVEVVGDGKSAVRSLLRGDPRQVGHHLYVEDIVACMAARAGYSLDDILPAGERLQVDFRYGSVLQSWATKDPDALDALSPALLTQLREAGAAMLACVPASVRTETVFSLDAVVDADGLAWWVDMDAEPLLHPAVYPAMLEDLLGLRQTAANDDEAEAGVPGLASFFFWLPAC